MDKLILIDAYALIFRAYYGLIRNPRINSKGMNTSAVMGFCNTLHEVLTKEQPRYVGVAFDHGKTFRHDAFPAYKAQRDATPEDISRSVPYIRRILEAMHIPALQADGFEADDVIGTLATTAGQKGILTYMLTPDKDYGQLITERVHMYKPRHGGGYEIVGPEQIQEKYGIASASQVVDVLALMGDAADNYPGCPGVGEKTAAKLIQQFGCVEELLLHTDQLKGKQREKVEAAAADIKMSKFLATIRTDVPLTFDLDALTLKPYDESALREIFAELEFKTMAQKWLGKTASAAPQQLDLFAPAAAPVPEETPTTPLTSYNEALCHHQLVENEAQAKELCSLLLTKEKVAIDTETTSPNAMEAQLVGMSFATEKGKAWYVAVPQDISAAQHIVEIFRPLFEHPTLLKVGQNIKYDLEVLSHYHVEVAGPLFDTMIAHYLLQPELRHNMDFMAESLLNYRTIHIEALIGPAGKGQRNMAELPPQDILAYAAEDADITLQLQEVLQPKLAEAGVEQLFWEVEMPLVRVLTDMELTGVRIDTAALSDTAHEFSQRMHKHEQRAWELAGEQFNLSSPKQVGEILFSKMKLVDKPRKTKTGQYVTSEEVLQSLRDRSPVVEEILSYRGLKKLLSTYVEALPKLVNSQTGRIHTSFNQTVTATGRLSSSDPNLQNIPVRDDDGKEIRRCFIPEPGCLWFSADYSQIELRIMAHLSQDPHMKEAFLSGQDIHRATAAKIWKVSLDEVSSAQRKQAKQANFGIIYGITSFGLAQRMGMDNGEARQLISDYFATFPLVAQYMEQAKEQARQNGFATTLYGRKRYLPDIHSQSATVRGFAERNAINAPIQGTEADIIKMAMIGIWKRFRAEKLQSRMTLQVHDELNFSVLPSEREQVERIVIEEMQQACQLSIPLVADAGWGKNWLEAH